MYQWLRNLGSLEKLNKMQLYEDHLRALRMSDPTNLQLSGYGVFSQNDEDGILQEIFKRIGTTNKVAVEIAAGNGIESNTHLLLQTGWQCFWYEAQLQNISIINTHFQSWIQSKKLQVFERWISAETIEQTLSHDKVPKKFDLLSLDIDGQEYWLWHALKKWQPRVVVVEYNGTLGPDVAFTIPRQDTFMWDQHSMYGGASLQALTLLAKQKGYTLVGCNYTGVNAFFVRDDLAKKHFKRNNKASLFQKPFIGGYVRSGYERTVGAWEQIHA